MDEDAILDAREEHQALALDVTTRQGRGPVADFDDVEIGRNVTREQLLSALATSRALRFVRVKLRADGMLVVTKLPNFEYASVVLALRACLARYAAEQQLFVASGVLCCGDVTVARTDATLVRGDATTIAVWEVDVERATCRHVVEAAAEYLSGYDVVVIALKFFPPRIRESDLTFPALAAVFHRGSGGSVQATQLRSFGNTKIEPHQLEGLPVDSLPIPGSDGSLVNVAARLEVDRRVICARSPMVVELPAPCPPIAMDLANILAVASRGWAKDERVRRLE